MNQNTRGTGILEGFLSTQRAKLANSKIPSKYRKGKILDIGCGTVPYFLLNTKFKEKYGIDYSLQKDKKYKDISLKKESINSGLPFQSNYFDIVTMLAVFEHIEPDDLQKLLSEIHRVLKKDGLLILTTPCVWTDRLLRFLASLNFVSKEEIEEHKGAYSHKDIKRYLKLGNFKDEDIELGYFELWMNNWAIAKK
ncbi:MAG: methyltransferase domain-containing protein [Candidatus Dojkabacteria bacterium]|jgi:ubiquinone/menaquinone biosynthesis C-methylase UbiE